MDRRLTVTEFVTNKAIRVCNIKWLPLFNSVWVDGLPVGIVSIDFENNIIYLGENVSNATEFLIPEVPLFVGTRMKTSSEWLNYSSNNSKKIPFIWLSFNPNPTSSKPLDPLSSIYESWSNVQMYFISDIDRTNWETTVIIEERLKYLYEWSEWFIRSVKSLDWLLLSSDTSSNYFPVFGVEQSNGSIKDIIDDNLCAVSLLFSIDNYDRNCAC